MIVMATDRNAVNMSITETLEPDEALHRVKAKLEQGALQAESGQLIGGEEAFEELRELIEERRSKMTAH